MKMETLCTCPVCQSSRLSPFLTCKDYTVSQEEFTLVRCDTCGFVFTNPRPTEAEIGRYYQSTDYISHSNTKKGIISQVYHAVRRITLKNKLSLLNRLVPGKGRLLDVGCGTGMFLSVCQENGWTVSGIEPDPGARKLAEEQIKQPVQDTILGSFPGETFQAITLWHVLEHIHRLEETLTWLQERLATDGRLIIAVPNLESHDAAVYGEHWAAYDVPRHLYHFAPNTLKPLMGQYGFIQEETLPMPFDSFYVSMLSTRYRDGKTRYVEAVQQGLKSNRLGKGERPNYSSLIYVFKKR